VTNSNRGDLGVEVGTTTSGGLLVAQLQRGGPAATAGIKTGELITSINGTAADLA
jgi:putative serine protease PepD